MNNEAKKLRRLKLGMNLAGMIAIMLAISGFGAYVVVPFMERESWNEQRISQLESLLQRQDKFREEHRKLKSNLVSLRTNVVRTLQRLPKEMHDTEFVESVKSLGGSLGVEVSNYHIANVEHHQSFSMVNATFEGTGSFASICKFLDRVHHFPRLTEIAHLEIEPTGNLQRYPFQVTFVLYFIGQSHDRRIMQETL